MKLDTLIEDHQLWEVQSARTIILSQVITVISLPNFAIVSLSGAYL